MKIAIISDTHDNLVTLKQALGWIKKENIEEIIHCGDVSAPETLEELSRDFAGPINLALGNADAHKFKTDKNVTVWGETGEIAAGSDKIAFTHFKDSGRKLAESGKYTLVFYGHTHKPWEEKVNGCRLINPGNLASMFYKATFTVYDTEKDILELKILERLIKL